MYPGTIAMKQAARSPAPEDQSSLVRKYVAKAVKPLEKCLEWKTYGNEVLFNSIPEKWGKKNTNIPDMDWNI